jgi:transmembrane sensor
MENYIRKILQNFVRFQYSDSLTKQIQHWLIGKDNSDLKEQALKEIWDTTEAKADSQTELSFSHVLQRLNVAQPEKSRSIHFPLWRYAAAVAILCVSVITTFWLTKNTVESKSVLMVEQYIKKGETGSIVLPDGSTAHLNSGSYILYPENFKGDTRVVYLLGEGNFQVAKNPNKPFIVRSANLSVTALGTEFDVRAYPEEDEIIATLLKGKVKVDTGSDTINYILSPGEQVIYNRKTSQSVLLSANINDVTAWQRGEIVFRGCTANEIFRELERRYGITFRCNPEIFNDDKYNFSFKKNADFKQIIEVLQIVMGGFDYQLCDDICYVKSRKKMDY